MRICVMLKGSADDAKAATTAAALAKRLGAQLEGLFVQTDVALVVAGIGDGTPPLLIDSVVESVRKDDAQRAARAREAFLAAMRAQAIEVRPSDVPKPGLAGWFQETGSQPADNADLHEGLADLVVFAPPSGDAQERPGAIGHTLLTLRRPLVIARGEAAHPGARILVAFNGSQESCAALLAARPLLAQAKLVEVVHFQEHDLERDQSARAVRRLAQEGIEAKAVSRKVGSQGPGREIATYASFVNADLVVMGGYGRSRLRELVLGGATRHMLHNSPAPVLFAH